MPTPTTDPRREPRSTATRSATEDAERRRGCDARMRQGRPASTSASRMSCGICVVLPQPVAPSTMLTCEARTAAHTSAPMLKAGSRARSGSIRRYPAPCISACRVARGPASAGGGVVDRKRSPPEDQPPPSVSRCWRGSLPIASSSARRTSERVWESKRTNHASSSSSTPSSRNVLPRELSRSPALEHSAGHALGRALRFLSCSTACTCACSCGESSRHACDAGHLPPDASHRRKMVWTSCRRRVERSSTGAARTSSYSPFPARRHAQPIRGAIALSVLRCELGSRSLMGALGAPEARKASIVERHHSITSGSSD
eukprot:scaffold302315_cov27-Tisochrysis_lutea.AAC.4